MPGVQCVICLSSDTSADEWCVLRECGHVFHTHCVLQSLEHNRRCPQCRTEYSRRKYGTNNPPYQRLFFDFSDEPGSQPPSSADGSKGGVEAVQLQQVAFLHGQLRDKDRRIQTISTQLTEAEERGNRLEEELSIVRAGLREKELRLQEKILELSREHKQVKGLANQVANLTSQLKTEASRASLLALASDHSLAGSALAAEVDKLVRLGLKAPNDFWEKLMSERSQIIIATSNKHAREKAALERRLQQLQTEVEQLQQQVATLKRNLAAQQQPGGTLLANNPAQEMRPHATSVGVAGSTRHGIRRFGAVAATLAGSTIATSAAAAEDDPLVRSYDVLSMRQTDLPAASARQACQRQQEKQRLPAQWQPPDARSALAAATSGVHLDGVREEDDELVVLDVDDDDGEELSLQEADAFSEIESDGEREQQAAARPAGRQQQNEQLTSQQQQQQELRCTRVGSVLGKRSQPDPFTSSQAASAEENWPCSIAGTNSSLSEPLLAGAGPGRQAMQYAPGKSFIRNTAAASVGVQRGKYISSGPDGKGGIATAYQGGEGSAPLRLSQKQLDLRALQQAGSTKRPGAAGAAGSQTAAAAAMRRNNAMPITSFFAKAQK